MYYMSLLNELFTKAVVHNKSGCFRTTSTQSLFTGSGLITWGECNFLALCQSFALQLSLASVSEAFNKGGNPNLSLFLLPLPIPCDDRLFYPIALSNNVFPFKNSSKTQIIANQCFSSSPECQCNHFYHFSENTENWPLAEGILSWLKHLANAVVRKGEGAVWLLHVVFTSFPNSEWVQTTLSLCSHMSVLFLTSFLYLSLLFFFPIVPKVIDGGAREGTEVKPTSGKSELACQIVCELRRLTHYSLCVIIIRLMEL